MTCSLSIESSFIPCLESTPAHNPVSPQKPSLFSAIASCDIEPPRNVLHRSKVTLSSAHQQRGVIATSRANFCFALQLESGATLSMSGFRAQSACIALMLAAMAPLLAGCDEPTAATAAVQPSEPDVSVVTVRPQPARWCANCRAASRRRASPKCVRASPASWSSACSTRAARSRPAIRSTGSIRGRSRSRCNRPKRRWRAPRPRSNRRRRTRTASRR